MSIVSRESIIDEMCKGCLRAYGKRCLVQSEPSYVWNKYGKCWSKITDPEKAKAIEEVIIQYRGRSDIKYLPLEALINQAIEASEGALKGGCLV